MTVFGLKWTQDTDSYTRTTGGGETNALTHLAVTSPTNAETLAAVAEASTYDPWMSMVRCNLSDEGVITATGANNNTSTAAGPCYTDTAVVNMGQVMVKLKKFWYTTDHNPPIYRWWISNDASVTGADYGHEPAGADHAWAVHPAFIRNSVTKDQIYLGAYEGYYNTSTSMLESKAGVTPTASKTIVEFRTAARARAGAVADKWEQQDYLSTCAVQLLYLIEYGNFNSQLVVGQGNVVNSVYLDTGLTISYGNTTHGTTPSQTSAMAYRGIENLWGNKWTVLDGVNMDPTTFHMWFSDNTFATDHPSPYADSGFVLAPTTVAYVSDIAVSSSYDYGFLPSVITGGSDTTYLCDASWVPATTYGVGRVLNYGGVISAGVGSGAFAFYVYNTSTSSGVNYGSRLMYIG